MKRTMIIMGIGGMLIAWGVGVWLSDENRVPAEYSLNKVEGASSSFDKRVTEQDAPSTIFGSLGLCGFVIICVGRAGGKSG